MSMFRVFAAVVCLSLVLCACDQEPSYQDTKGNTIVFSSYQGKWIILSYWANWCESCKKEIPVLNAFYNQSMPSNTALLGVNYDFAEPEQINRWVSQYGITYPVLTSDPAKQLKLGDITGLPALFIFNPKGKLVVRHFGAVDTKKLFHLIELSRAKA